MSRIVALILISFSLIVGLSAAATDEEILQFGQGVLAASMVNDPVLSINVNTLQLQDSLGEYSDTDVDWIGYELRELAGIADKIVKQYPGRFAIVEAKVLDLSGTMVGSMNIRVR